MRALVLFGLSFVVTVSASVELQINYHDSVGIPQAERIHAIEKEILASTNLGHNDLLQNRIVGGHEASLNDHPYFAGLLINLVGTSNQSVCGASLLTPNRLTTAAHCWFDNTKRAEQFLVVLGSTLLYSGGERIPTNQVITHPHYCPLKSTNDVAVIYLPRKARINNLSIKPINLPNEFELQNQFVGYLAVAIGYGKIMEKFEHSPILRHVKLSVITPAECARSYRPGVVTNNNICTRGYGGVGICGGDSGGPLVTFGNDGEPFLIGISSFVVENACDQGHPSSFSRVTSFYSFITQHL